MKAKKRHSDALWHEEIRSLGIREALIRRFDFHGGLSVSMICECSNRAESTVMKHIRRLVTNRIIHQPNPSMPDHYRKLPVPDSCK